MNPARFSQMMKYLTRAKKEKPDLPDVFPANKAPIPAKTQNVQETEAVNQFMLRNPRVEKAGGGRIGFDKAGIVRKGKGEFEGLFSVRAAKRSAADNIPGAVKFGPEAVYFKTEKEAKDFQKNFKRKVTMKPGATPSNDPERLKKINDFVKEFEKEYGKKPAAKNIRTALNEQKRVIPIYEKTYGVTLPTGSGAKLTNVEKDINKILKNPKIIEKLDAGKFPTITDVSRIIKLDPALSETRLVDLAEKLRENPKYKKIADDYLDQPGLTNLDEGFGGRKRKRSRAILENRFTKLKT